MGLAQAQIDVRAFNVVIMPAFATDTVCCSYEINIIRLEIRGPIKVHQVLLYFLTMTSWSTLRVESDILSNSSMQQTPPSLSTRAPLERWIRVISCHTLSNVDLAWPPRMFTFLKQAAWCRDLLWCMQSNPQQKNPCQKYRYLLGQFCGHIVKAGIYLYQGHQPAGHWYHLWISAMIRYKTWRSR
jgi:hypothetical protein